jgi:hypothetical protein
MGKLALTKYPQSAKKCRREAVIARSRRRTRAAFQARGLGRTPHKPNDGSVA